MENFPSRISCENLYSAIKTNDNQVIGKHVFNPNKCNVSSKRTIWSSKDLNKSIKKPYLIKLFKNVISNKKSKTR